MNPSREEQLFELVLEKPPAERAEFLAVLCGDDEALRQRVEALLAAHNPDDSFMGGEGGGKPTVRVEMEDNPPAEDMVGETIGRYKLLQKVGEGGCGVVYVAEQQKPVRRRVALKVIKLGMDTKNVVARFEAERQALALMDHPNIAKVLDAGATEMGRPYFVMELVRGIKITEYCDQNKLSTEERLDLFIQICQAIQHAHQKGIIHRDIKPSNILITLHDGVPVPKVIDFGIAKATEGRLTDLTVYTELHQFIGTPAYMSPEQAEMSGLDIDTRSDIYSLGVLLYELLTGRTPFDGRELISMGIDAMRLAIREKEPPRPSTRLSTLGNEDLTATAKRRSVDSSRLASALRGDLDWIAMKCLEKDRRRRYETANGLAMDIKRHLENEPVVARPPSKWYEFQKTVRRHKVGFATATAVGISLVIGLGFSVWQYAEQRQQRERAETEAAKAMAISGFLQEMLQSANPDAARGQDYSVRELLDDFSESLSDQLTDQPEVKSSLHAIMGRAFWRLALPERALHHHQRVLVLAAQSVGSNTTEVAESHVGCAWALYDLRDQDARYDQAEPHILKALSIYRPLREVECEGLLDALWIHQRWLVHQGKFAEADEALEEALTVVQPRGADHPTLASMMATKANSLHAQGRYREAETTARDALAMHRRTRQPNDLEIGWTLFELASSLRDQRKFEEQREALGQAREVFSAALSSESTPVRWVNEQLAESFTGSQDWPSLEALLLDSAQNQIDLRTLGWSLNELGKAHQNQQQFTKAKAAFEEALTIYSEQPMEGYDGLATALTKSLHIRPDWPALEALFQKCLQDRRAFLFKEDVSSEGEDAGVAFLLYGLSIVCERQDRQAESESYRQDAFRIMSHGEATNVCTFKFSGLVRNEGDIEMALRFTRQSFRVRANSRHDWAFNPLCYTAQHLETLGRVDEAKEALREGVELWKEYMAAGKRHHDEPLGNYLTALLGRGMLAEAELIAREEAASGRVGPINMVAWHYATSPDPTLRDGNKALRFAQQAVVATDRKECRILDTLAAAHAEAGDFASAMRVQQEAIDLVPDEELEHRKQHESRLRSYQAAIPYRDASPLALRALELLVAGNYIEAEPIARECLEARQVAMPDRWLTFNAMSMLGGALLGQGQYAEAEPLLLSGYEGMKQREDTIPAQGKVRLEETLERLVQLYEAWDKPDQAAEWKQTLAELE